MGEEENKPSGSNDNAKTSAQSKEGKPNIKDRMRDMGIMDRDKRPAGSAPARPWKLYITGAVIIAGVGLWYLTAEAPFSENPAAQPMAYGQHPGARGPYGWQTPPPYTQARAGNQPGYTQQAPPRGWSGRPVSPWGPPPPGYYGRRYGQWGSPDNPNINNQLNRAGSARQWPPQRRQYAHDFTQGAPYYGPPPTNGDKSTSVEASGNNAANQARPAPGWRRPPVPGQRPQWVGAQRPNYKYPPQSPQPRFGPPPQRHWNDAPPGWPREAWRTTRPEEAQKQQQVPERAAPPSRQWPAPPRRHWGPGYNPYGSYQASSYQSPTNKDNPWSQ